MEKTMELAYNIKFNLTLMGWHKLSILGEKFISKDDVCLILGDNVFYGSRLPAKLKRAVKDVKDKKIAKIFGYYVNDPERYGVVSFDNNGKAISLEENPKTKK